MALDRRDHGRHEPRSLHVDLDKEIHAEDQKENDAVADERACDVEHHPNERERDRHQYAGEEDTQRRLEAHDERLGKRAFLAKMRRGGRVDDRSGEYSTDEKADEPSDDEEDEKTAHELEEGGIREERDGIVGRLLRNPHEGRSAGERENDAEDDPRDDEGNKEDQAQDEEADRACTIDREDAIEDVPYTERS